MIFNDSDKGRKMILTDTEISECLTGGPKTVARMLEAAVLAKLAQGVEMPEPVANVSASSNGCIGFVKPDKNYYTSDQLTTAIAAERLQALEDAATLVESTELSGMNGDVKLQVFIGKLLIEYCKAIRALKGGG